MYTGFEENAGSFADYQEHQQINSNSKVMKHASRVNRTISQGSAGWAVHARANDMMASGEDVILLTIGDPDFETPAPIVETAVSSLLSGRTHYTPLLGEKKLRQAIADYQGRLYGDSALTADNVIVVIGAQCGLYVSAMCTLEQGDEVIVLDPTYSTYAYVLGASGAKSVFVPLRPERNFQVDPKDVAAAITDRTRAIFLNTPHNPTGAVVHREEMESLAALCLEHDLWMITDEVYGALTYEQAHICAASLPNMADRTLTISSLSKSHAMPGFRLGWVTGPAETINLMGNLCAGMLFGVSPFVQDAALEALTGSLGEIEKMRIAYRARRDLVHECLQDTPGISCQLPEGGLYMMIDIRETGIDAMSFADQLLDMEKVALLPGEAFGPGGKGHLRLSLVEPAEILAEACRRISRFAARAHQQSVAG